MADPQGESDLVVERGQFRAEYERELGDWLRRRLGYLCIVYAVYQIISVAALIIGSNTSEPPAAETRLPPRLEQRASEAERRSEAGLPMRPGDTRALALREEAEARKRDAERSREAIVSTVDALAAIAKDIAPGAKDRPGAGPRRAPVQERVIDRWWLERPAPPPEPPAAKPDELARAADLEGLESVLPVFGDAAQAAVAQPGLGADGTEHQHEASGQRATFILPWWLWVLISLPTFFVLAWFGLRVRPRLDTRAELVSAATRMILSLGLLNFGFECGMLLADRDASIRPLLSIFIWHLTASLFLPWSWRESLKPIIPLLACWFLLRLGLATSDDSWASFLLAVASVPFLFAPALVLCYARLRWHQSRFKSGFVGRRFLAMRREFIQARSLHESLFPERVDLGWLRFDFGYRPAADIGGDFIHTWTDHNDRFHLALIDVTGHGLASAMTVARIHGEIERLRDEHPDEGPARMLARLNRYFQRLLARHRLYATGVLITIDPRSGELRYASAGHPPVFVRSRGGTRELESTTFLLGAVDGETFGEEELTIQLEEGDRVILFTDGAYDAKNPRGERFGLDRLRELVRRPSAPPNWPQFLMNLVENFEAGLPEDDLLVAEVAFVSRRSLSSVTGDDAPVPRTRLSGASA